MSIDVSIVTASIGPLLEGLKVTAQVCVLGIPLGIVAGTLAAYCRAMPSRLLRALSLAYVEIVRNVPFLILVYLSFFGLPKLGLRVPAFAIGVAATAFSIPAATSARSCAPRWRACRTGRCRPRARWG